MRRDLINCPALMDLIINEFLKVIMSFEIKIIWFKKFALWRSYMPARSGFGF